MTSRPKTHTSLQHCRYYAAGRCNNGSNCKFSHGNEEPPWQNASTSTVGATDSPATHSLDERQKPCYYWKAGKCKNGSNCKFSHENEDPWAPVPECQGTVEGDDAPAVQPWDEHQQPCPYLKAGNCKNAWDCKFSHGHEDSWTSEGQEVDEAIDSPAVQSSDDHRKPCRYWQAGNCKHGRDCKFSHENEDPWASNECPSAAEAVESPAVQSSDEHQQPCPYLKAGNCKNAWDCKFSHGHEDSWASGGQNVDEAVDSPAVQPSDDRRKPCRYWQAGNCKNAGDCKFSHDNEDSWASESPSAAGAVDSPAAQSSNERQKPCRYWQAGNCKNAWDCKFSHETEDPWASECPNVAGEVDLPAAQSSDERRKPCRYWKAGNCKNGSDCNFSHENEDSWASECQGAVDAVDPSAVQSSEEGRKSCRYWKAGNCKNGSSCKFSHENEGSLASERQSTVEAGDTPAIQSQDWFRKPCRYWKAGNCKNGSDCVFSHGNEDSLTSDRRGASTGAPRVVNSPRIFSQSAYQTLCRYWKAGNCMRGDVCWFRHADNDPTDIMTARKEAVGAIRQVVPNPIITCGAGLDVIGLTAGFESCIIHVKNMSADAKDGDLHALMSQQGVDADRLYLVGVKGVAGRKVEVGTMTDE
ncbi:hypothetical protein EDD15DRAFT_2529702 [Pisolithus albus]|nr:hypothetical protein EDD15DRAFT_2529702 [Pisolithus albus]